MQQADWERIVGKHCPITYQRAESICEIVLPCIFFFCVFRLLRGIVGVFTAEVDEKEDGDAKPSA